MHEILRNLLHFLNVNPTGFLYWNSGPSFVDSGFSSAASKDLFCGQGNDGSINFDGSGSISGIATYSSGTYTLSKNISATAITISDNIIVNTNGYFLRVRGTLTLGTNSRIHNDGTDNYIGSTQPVTVTSGTMFLGGSNGTLNQTGNGAGTANTNTISTGFKLGGNGGQGGGTTARPGPAANSTAGSLGNYSAANGDIFIPLLTTGMLMNGTAWAKIYGGLGGSPGSGDGSLTDGTRGGGGSGGGVCIVIAGYIVWGTGSKISADGGDGSPGALGATNDSRCGGGGGGGGVCIVVCRDKSGTSNVTAAGGTGGTSYGTGAGMVNGSNGATGYVMEVVG